MARRGEARQHETRRGCDACEDAGLRSHTQPAQVLQRRAYCSRQFCKMVTLVLPRYYVGISHVLRGYCAGLALILPEYRVDNCSV